jgi:hypothetical protein
MKAATKQTTLAKKPMLIVILAIVIVTFFVAQIVTVHRGQYDGNEQLDESDLFTTVSLSNNMDETANHEEIKKDGFIAQATQSQQQESQLPPQTPDGFFNGHPIHFQPFEEGFHSNVHCVGENFGSESWKYRSCHFQNFCFDLHNQSFVLFTSPEQHQLNEAMRDANLTEFTSSFSFNTTLSIGGINSKWAKDHLHMEWFPKLQSIDDVQNSGYYIFSNDAALVPFHSMAGFNPGHLVWDDFLPIYTLMRMFQLIEKDLVLMRYKPTFWQWASCDRRWNSGRKPYCRDMLKKFLPLMGQQLETMTTQENVNMTWLTHSPNINKSKYVCAKNGAAGLGMLTDHGTKLHGWMKVDYLFSHNVGRGGTLFEFRDWMMKNINVNPDKSISKAPFRIVFSINSSSTYTRNINFINHIKLVKEKLGDKYELEVHAIQLSKLSLLEQIELVSGASIMITMCGGGAVTGMFLPKGASLLAYFNEIEPGGDTSPRLDWDLLNNLSYIRVHWLPRPQSFVIGDSAFKDKTAPRAADYEAFIRLIDHELDIISHL